MKLHLPTLVRRALLACAACATTAHAATFLAEGVDADDLAASTRFYDGGKGRDWSYFSSNAYQIYAANGKDLGIFGALAGDIGTPAYSMSLDFGKLTNDSGHCWAYTSANMLQYWQGYYGVFAHKAGEQGAPQPVHGLNYDAAYLTQLGGTQSLKLNKLFYDNFDGKAGGSTNKAFGWYLAGENDWSGQVANGDPGGYFARYFPDYRTTHRTSDVFNGATIRTLSSFSDDMKSHFGYTQAADGSWQQTTKGQIVHLELSQYGGSHAITSYGFETNAEGNISALYVVNSDDAQFQLVKVYGQMGEYGFDLYGDEACSISWGGWRVTGWSSINTPQVLKDMLAEYEGGSLTWTGTASSWTDTSSAADPDTLPTDASGWMVYAGTGTQHAGYYDSYYAAGRAVAFNDAAASATVNVGQDLAVAAMAVDNSAKDYLFTGEGQSITTGAFTKSGTGALEFDGVALAADSVTLTGNATFDKLNINGALHASGETVTLRDDATLHIIDQGTSSPAAGVSTLAVTGGTTEVRVSNQWTNLKALALSDEARITFGASVSVAEDISLTAASGKGTLPEGGRAGITATYCIAVGTAGKAGTGNVELDGDMQAGAYIDIRGNADITGDLKAVGSASDHHITIGGNAHIGGALTSNKNVTIGGEASVGGAASVGGNLTVQGASLVLAGGGTVGGMVSAADITLGADATFARIGAGTSDASTGGTTALHVAAGTTTVQLANQWTNLKSLELSDAARLSVGASLCVAENIAATAATGTLAEGTAAGLSTRYCLAVGTAGKAGTGNVELAGDLTAGAYINILGNADIAGNVVASGNAADHHITIGGDTRIGGRLETNKNVTIAGEAAVGGAVNVGGALAVGGTLALAEGGSVGGKLAAQSLTLAQGASLSATGGVTLTGGVQGAAAEAGGARARVETAGTMELGGSAANVDLKARAITLGAADGHELELDSVGIELEGGVLTLSHATMRGDCRFTSSTPDALALVAEDVLFVLDERNSSGRVHPQAPVYGALGDAGSVGDGGAAAGSNTYHIDAPMLAGLNVSGSMTLDLSHWADAIRAGGHDSLLLTFAEGADFSQAQAVHMTLGGTHLAPLSLAAEAPNTFRASLANAVSPASAAIPEPTTATLSLLALAALAARRRRR